MYRLTIFAKQVAVVPCMMLFLGGTALAQQPEADTETSSLQVSLKGIDLSTRAGQTKAQAQIILAVRKIYRDFGPQDLAGQTAATEAAMSRLAAFTAAANKSKPSSSVVVAFSQPDGGSASSR